MALQIYWILISTIFIGWLIVYHEIKELIDSLRCKILVTPKSAFDEVYKQHSSFKTNLRLDIKNENF